jgi:hypothetical protein
LSRECAAFCYRSSSSSFSFALSSLFLPVQSLIPSFVIPAINSCVPPKFGAAAVPDTQTAVDMVASTDTQHALSITKNTQTDTQYTSFVSFTTTGFSQLPPLHLHNEWHMHFLQELAGNNDLIFSCRSSSSRCT